MHWEMQVQQPPVACLNNMHATEILTQSPHHSIKLLNKSQNCSNADTWDRERRRGEAESSEQGQRQEDHIQDNSSTFEECQPKLECQRIPSFQTACPTVMHKLPRNTEKDNSGAEKRRKLISFKKLT